MKTLAKIYVRANEVEDPARRNVHSEVDWPLAAWRGENGVDWGIAENIFGSLK